MIHTFGISQQGKAHVRNNIVCQDAHYFKIIDEGICIASVADGLGSEKFSDIASKIASKSVVDYCVDKIGIDLEVKDILIILKEAFIYALNKIEKRAISDSGDINQYDTTLSMCVFFDGKLIYGHSGDSGIIALANDGKFYKVTEQQRDSYGRVYPLCFGEDYWKFEVFDKTVAGVILATDGILELFYPVYIKDMETSIYTSLAKYFLNIRLLSEENFNINEYIKKRENYIDNIPEEVVDDDKTIIGIMDDKILVKWQDDSYYKEPDWNEFKKKYREKYNKKAYLEEYKNE
mgnify:CR=1 FL=1